MNKHIDEGDANLNGTATEDRLGSAAEQAQPEGRVGEGPSSPAPEAEAVGADAGDGAVHAAVSQEPAMRVCRVDGCGVTHDRNYLVCGTHWRMLPPDLQGRINASFRRVKVTGIVNREYAKLSALAVNWLNAGGMR